MSIKEQEIGEQIEGFTIIRTIGEGSFGKVKLGVHKLTGLNVAIKVFIKEIILERKDQERVSREIKIMKKVRHPYIIQLYQIIETQKNLYLIMEYAQNGDLFDQINKKQSLTQLQAQQHFAQLILGLEYLHSVGIAHRDLKPQNILLSPQSIKICDFGLGNFYKQSTLLSTACGSPCYAPPQMLNRLEYNPQKTDIWSCGIILYAMVLGYLPFEDDNTSILYVKIKTEDVAEMPFGLSSQCKSIILQMLTKDPQKRPSINELKKHKWLNSQYELFKGVKFEMDEKIVQQVCQKYKIQDKQKMINSLTKNKHNKLTTAYYLGEKAIKKQLNSKIIQPPLMKSTISFQNLIEDEDANFDQQQKIIPKQPIILTSHYNQQNQSSSQQPLAHNEKQILTTISKNTSTHQQIKQEPKLNNQKSTSNFKDKPFLVSQYNQEKINLNHQKISKLQKVQPRRKLKKFHNMIENVLDQSKLNQNIKQEGQSSKIKPKVKHVRNQHMIIYRPSINNSLKVSRFYQHSQSKDKSLIKKEYLSMKQVFNDPYIYDVKKIVFTNIRRLKQQLQLKEYNGYIQYFQIDKQCIYVTQCSKYNKSIQNIISQLNQT